MMGKQGKWRAVAALLATTTLAAAACGGSSGGSSSGSSSSASKGGSRESIMNAVAVKPSTSGASGVMAEGLRRAVTTVTVAAQVRARVRKASLSTANASSRPRGA